MVQWLRLFAPNAGGLGSIPGRGTRSRMTQLRYAKTKTQLSQKRESFKNKRKSKGILPRTSTSVSLIMLKTLCGSHKLWRILKEIGIPDHLTCLLRNLYAGVMPKSRNLPMTTREPIPCESKRVFITKLELGLPPLQTQRL